MAYTYELENDLHNSELCIAHIMELLLNFGIRKRDVSENDIHEKHPQIDPSLIAYALEWLREEEIIRCGEWMYQQESDGFQRRVGLTECVLTSKGFQLFGQKLPNSQTNETVGQAIKEISSGKKSYASVGDFLGGLLGGFTKSINS